MFSTFWLLKVCLDGVLISKYFVGIFSERRARAWGPHGEWKTEKDPQAEDDLFQLPARCSAEALPEGAVPRSARESRAGGSARPHSDTGKLPETVYHVGFSNWSILLEARESGLSNMANNLLCNYASMRNYAKQTLDFCVSQFNTLRIHTYIFRFRPVKCSIFS